MIGVSAQFERTNSVIQKDNHKNNHFGGFQYSWISAWGLLSLLIRYRQLQGVTRVSFSAYNQYMDSNNIATPSRTEITLQGYGVVDWVIIPIYQDDWGSRNPVQWYSDLLIRHH